jgi:glycosyltransferase involved in cell wall biosynthesis
LARGAYRRVELILVNDNGSPVEIPDGFPFPVVHVNLLQHRGRAGAAQAGLDAATAECVAFLDDDDIVFPEHLSTLAAVWKRGDLPIVYSDAAVALYERSGNEWHCLSRSLPYSRDFDPDILLLDNYIPFHTLLMDRTLTQAVGRFDESLPIFEDWDYLIRLSQQAAFHHVRQVTCEYRHFTEERDQALGANPSIRPDFLENKIRVLAKHAQLITPDRLARAVVRMRGETVRHQAQSRLLAAQVQELQAPGGHGLRLVRRLFQTARGNAIQKLRASDSRGARFLRRLLRRARATALGRGLLGRTWRGA